MVRLRGRRPSVTRHGAAGAYSADAPEPPPRSQSQRVVEARCQDGRDIRRSVVCFCVSEGCGIGVQIRTLCYGLPSARGRAEPSSDRAILSPMTAAGMLVLPEMTAGISDA